MRAFEIAGLAFLYVAASGVGGQLAVLHPVTTTAWPATGLSLAALMVVGYGIWPGIFIGALLANAAAHASLGMSLGLAATSTIEALLGAYLVNRFAGGNSAFDRPLDVVKFALLGAGFSTAIGATLSVIFTAEGGLVTGDIVAAWLTRWLGDAIRVLVSTPGLVLWAVDRRPWTKAAFIEFVTVTTVAALASAAIFMAHPPDRSAVFLIFPILMWAPFRLGLRETATIAFIVTSAGIWATFHGLGPFAPTRPEDLLLSFQVFSGVNTVSALILAALVHERLRVETELRTLTSELEARVDARTEDLRQNEARYRELFDKSPIALTEVDFSGVKAVLDVLRASGVTDLNGHLTEHPDMVLLATSKIRILALNQRTIDLFEASSADELLSRVSETRLPDSFESFHEQLIAFSEGQPFETTVRRRTLKGRRLFLRVRASILPGDEHTWARGVASILDVTGDRETERQVRQSLEQQEVLLKEIHHRVKNNLAVISSLFYLEAAKAEDPATAQIMEESQRRVRSMALVHETLYGSENLGEIDFGEYARVLSNEIRSAHGNEHVSLVTELEPVTVSLDLAVPCGLILNELVSNAFKHAFPNGRSGRVRIVVRTLKSDCLLQVDDDGIGVSSGREAHANSLGLRLIGLLANQLRGTFRLEPGPQGTEARLVFPLTGAKTSRPN